MATKKTTGASRKAAPKTGKRKAKDGTNRGKNPKLTKAVQTRIHDAIARGHTNERAILLSGIKRTAFYTWKAKGEEDLAAGKNSIYADFADMLKSAEAEFIDHHLKNIQAAGDDGNWQASMTLLERKFHREFGRRQLIEHSGTDEHPPVSIRLVSRKPKAEE
jgi:hypothetical protein